MKRQMLAAMLALGATSMAVACSDDDDATGPVAEQFRATLNGTSERPTQRTTPATGTAELTLRRDTLRWTINMTQLTNVTAGHIHVGGPEEAGGIILGLTGAPGTFTNSQITGLITRSTYTPPSAPNAGVTFDSLLILMRTNKSYVNLHTNNTANDPTNNSGPGDFPGGEIRGQVVKP